MFSNELVAISTINLIAHASLYFLPSTHVIIVKYNLFHLADSMSVWNLLREFRIRQVHMAVVLNEYGGTIGVCPYETYRLYLFFLQTEQKSVVVDDSTYQFRLTWLVAR